MQFTNHFHVQLPIDEAWTLLTDIPRVMPCLPGASLKGMSQEGQYLGSITVKLGPIKLSFDGKAEFVRKDELQHIAWLKGSGLDPKGRGSAESEFSFALTPAMAGGTDVTVTTSLQLSGSVAQYGRGSGMIAEVASHILKQFEDNLAASLQYDMQSTSAMASPSSDTTNTVAASLGTTRQAGVNIASGQTTNGIQQPANLAVNTQLSALELQALLLQSQTVLAQAQATLIATQQMLNDHRRHPEQGKQKELNMLSIGLKAIWSQFKGIFTRR